MRMMSVAMAVIVLGLTACGSSHQPGAPDGSAGQSGEAPATLALNAPADFAVCTGCHSIVAGEVGIGPSMSGIVGRKAGSLPGFAYSAALQNSGIIWTPEKLDTWLTEPMAMVPGTKMSFGGYSDPRQRQAVIAYLKTLR